MGILQSYDPFSAAGQYNINVFLYENKRKIIGIVTITVLLLICLLAVQFTGSSDVIYNKKLAVTSSIPQPKFGIGPFGPGLYLPTKESIMKAI